MTDISHEKKLGYKHMHRDYSHRGKTAIYMAGRQGRGLRMPDNISLDFQPPELLESTCQLLGCWACGMCGNSGKLL